MTKTVHRIYVGSFFIVAILSTVLLVLNGYDYYSKPLEKIGTTLSDPTLRGTDQYETLKSKHELLRPTGFIGHGLGILGSLMMIAGVSIYMIRKRIRRFHNLGLLKHWLEFHIFLCTLGPIFVLFHTSFKFGGIVAVSFWSMVLVVLSGILGRFIYVQIPRTIQGKELDITELKKLKQNITETLAYDYQIDSEILFRFNQVASAERYKDFRLSSSISFLVRDIFSIRRIMKDLRKYLSDAGVTKIKKKEIIRLANNEITLARRIGLLRTMHKLFRYWHIFHLPFAITMFIIMIIHIVVAVTFGYTWIF
ncbi:MAG: hypothetical protein Kow0098_10570 [Ignavibacteriaceae bacterium]